MKNVYSALFCLLLAGCVKEPWPGTPEPEAPQFLVRTVTVLLRTGTADPLPGDNPESFLKEVYEYHYNAHYKPMSRYYYAATGTTGADTLNLQLNARDTLYYDAQQRIVQSEGYAPGRPTPVTRKKFTYTGNDTLPATRQEWVSGQPDPDSMYFRGATSFVYKTDTVLAVSENLYHGGLDTMTYVYAGGNFQRLYASTGYEEDVYSTYDNAINVERSMNLSHGMALSQPLNYVVPPVLSRNNWTGQGPQTRVKTIEYLPGGNLVNSYVVTESYPVPGSYTVRIEYFTP
ncbi:MAG: hypothetical protein ACTHLD_01145 [Chitinophaga sp.]